MRAKSKQFAAAAEVLAAKARDKRQQAVDLQSANQSKREITRAEASSSVHDLGHGSGHDAPLWELLENEAGCESKLEPEEAGYESKLEPKDDPDSYCERVVNGDGLDQADGALEPEDAHAEELE